MNIQKKEIKEIVKTKYSKIAKQTKEDNEKSCCGSGGCCEIDYTVFSESYNHLEGYNADADLGLGCGIPTQFIQIKPGDTVLDLGSGAGNDCFVARALVGEAGKVIGLDFSDNMLEKARKNAEKLGYSNIEFIAGDIEDMPIPHNSVDVVVSNCVLNLVPDKQKAFSGIYKVLKPGGSFSISDVVLQGELPPELKESAVMYAGCVAGAIEKKKYLVIIDRAGFRNIEVQKVKEIDLPDGVLRNFFQEEDIRKFRESETGIYSITVTALK
ncbi:MAG: arsenite methyltransferase [Deltaproteobacteria bacterium]|nr:arsenite methyltransferase [Deltaproteobacteria bacterium]MBL7110825.1 arsenite methyltransferase [Bacteroidales bacterium]